jgi:hypothetical protein
MSRERASHTLQTTAIFNEAYMRLLDNTKPVWQLIAAPWLKKTGSTPRASSFQPQRCSPISITVIPSDSFKFQKRGQFFIRSHDETLSVAAMLHLQSRSFAR